MTTEERPLYEIVEKLQAAWNNGDSVAWTEQFGDDADFIHVLGGHFHGRTDIERGHRTSSTPSTKVAATISGSKASASCAQIVARVFLFANLTWYLNGAEQHIQARPALVAEKGPDGRWKIAVFQNTLVTTNAVPTLSDTLAKAHPIKGNPPVK